MGEYATITEADYNSWIPPRVALKRLEQIGRQNAIAAIRTCLEAGTLRAVAKTITQGEDQDAYVLLNNRRIPSREMDDTFWATGVATIAPDSLRHVSYQHVRVPRNIPTVYLTGVRFDRHGIEELEKQAGIIPKVNLPPVDVATAMIALALDDANKKKAIIPIQENPSGSVSTLEIDQWYAALLPEQQQFGVRRLYRLANDHFKPRSVSRKQVEKFGEGRGVGRRKNAP